MNEQYGILYYTEAAKIVQPKSPITQRLFRNTADNKWYIKKSDGSIELFTATLSGVMTFVGSYDASTNLYPANGSGGVGVVNKGDTYVISVAGVLGGTAVEPGDILIAEIDNPAQVAANWTVIEHNFGFVPLSGSGTPDQFPKYLTPNTMGDSILNEKLIAPGYFGVGVNTLAPAARQHITGFGNTSATVAFRVDSSTVSNIFSVRDDSALLVNGFRSVMINYGGFLNTFIGDNAGNVAANNDGNTAVGRNSMSSLANGFQNVAVGNNSLTSITNGGSSVAVGFNSQISTTGSENTSIGANTLMTNTTGASNTVIGTRSGFTGNGSSNVFVGYESGYFETGSNTLFIDNIRRASEADARIKGLIYGIFDASVANQFLRINGELQIIAGIGTKYARAGGSVFDSYADSANAGVGSTNLYTYIVPANTLVENGDKITGEFSVIIAATVGATQDTVITFAGITIFSYAPGFSTVIDLPIKLQFSLIKTGANTARAVASMNSSNVGNVLDVVITDEVNLTGINFAANNNLILIGTTNGGANEVIAKQGTIFWHPAAA